MSPPAVKTATSDSTTGPAVGRDDRLCGAALGLLRSSGYRPLVRLNCEVHDGRAVLSGVVPTFYLKQLAQALLLRLGELQGVKNLVEVRPAGSAPEAGGFALVSGVGGARHEQPPGPCRN
jgi:hypothetical protein